MSLPSGPLECTPGFSQVLAEIPTEHLLGSLSGCRSVNFYQGASGISAGIPARIKTSKQNWMKSGFAGSSTNPIFHFHLTLHVRLFFFFWERSEVFTMLELANCTKLSNKGGQNWNTLSFHGLIRKWQIVQLTIFCGSNYNAVNIFMKVLQSRASPLWALLIWLIAVCQPSAQSLSCSLQGKNPIFLLLEFFKSMFESRLVSKYEWFARVKEIVPIFAFA